MTSSTHHGPRALHPVRPLLTLAVGAVLVTSSCAQATPSAAPGTTQTVTLGGVRLEASMAWGGPVPGTAMGATMGATKAPHPGLVVEYTLTNLGATPVLAYDVVPQDLGSAVLAKDLDPDHAWVYEESGVLRLSKQGFAPAPNVRFAAAPVTGGHIVAPGADITGRAYAGSPLTLDVPGDSFEAPRAAVDPALEQWQLCIQVSDRVAQARPTAAGDGTVQAAAAAPQGDELVCTQPAPIPVG